MPKRYQPRKYVKKHEIHPAIGAPLWWCASFARKHWKFQAWVASLIAVSYMPYLEHEHAYYLDDRRCDRISYAAHVAYQYGCEGRDCSEDAVAYEETVRMLLGSISAGCHAPAPIRPDEAVVLVIDAVSDAIDGDDMEAIIPVYDTPQEVELAEVSG